MNHLTDLRVWLDALDGPVVVGGALLALAILWLLGLAITAAAKADTTPRPRRESHSELNHRLDLEAAAATRPGSSNRKAPRVQVGGAR